MARIIAVCTSLKKGTKKENVNEALLQENYGLVGDAHAESGINRQVSLLAIESINQMRNLGLELSPGDFAENLTCEGLEPASLPVGTHLALGEKVVLEISQIGKKCHTGCAIFRQIGKCIMPKEGVFARVIKGGLVRTGDLIRVVKNGN